MTTIVLGSSGRLGSAISLFANDALGPPRIVIHAAGATADSLLVKMKEETFDRVIALNLSSAAWVLAAAAGRMSEGAIILLGSHAASGREGQANYATAKAGLIPLARSADRELSPSIRGNVVLPATTPPPSPPQARRSRGSLNPGFSLTARLRRRSAVFSSSLPRCAA